MPAAARVDDPITHSESHSEATKQMWEGIGTGILIGVAIIGLTVLTGGGDLVVAGAALAAGGTVLSLGGKGFLQGAKQGQQQVERHGEVKTGSGNVTINKHAAAAACLSAIDCDEHSGSQKLAQGSRTVTINGKMASRVGDKSTCDGVIAAGSGNVTIGGEAGQCAAISQEVADWETGLAKGAVVVGTVAQIVGMVLTGVGAVRAVMLAPAALRTMMMVRMGAGLTSGVLFGSGVSYYGGQKYGQGSWQQEAMGTSAGLLGGMMGDAAASSGPRIIGGIKSGFADAFEPGGLFGGPELAPAGGPGGFGGGVDPEIVPRAPGSPGMDAWNPPANDPMQMTGTGGSGGSVSDPQLTQLSQPGGLKATEGTQIARPDGSLAPPSHPLDSHGPDRPLSVLDGPNSVEQRMIDKPNMLNSSKFTDRATMETAIGKTIDAKQTDISNWLSTSPPAGANIPNPIDYNPGMGNLGAGYSRPVGGAPYSPTSTPLESVRIILKSDGSGGYIIQTAYPQR